MPTESRSFSSEKSYSPSRLMCSHEMTELLTTAARFSALSSSVDAWLRGCSRTQWTTRLSGMSSITSESGGRLSIDISRQIVSGNFVIRHDRRPQTVSFYVPLRKRAYSSLSDSRITLELSSVRLNDLLYEFYFTCF